MAAPARPSRPRASLHRAVRFCASWRLCPLWHQVHTGWSRTAPCQPRTRRPPAARARSWVVRAARGCRARAGVARAKCGRGDAAGARASTALCSRWYRFAFSKMPRKYGDLSAPKLCAPYAPASTAAAPVACHRDPRRDAAPAAERQRCGAMRARCRNRATCCRGCGTAAPCVTRAPEWNALMWRNAWSECCVESSTQLCAHRLCAASSRALDASLQASKVQRAAARAATARRRWAAHAAHSTVSARSG